MLSVARLIAVFVALLTARFRRRLLTDCRCAFAADLVANILSFNKKRHGS
jgi:hypothetical protein